MSDQRPSDDISGCTPDPQELRRIPIETARQQARALDSAIARIDSSFSDLMRSLYQHERSLTGAHERAFETLRAESEEIRALLEPARDKLSRLFRLLGMKYTDYSGMNCMDRARAMAAQRRYQNELACPPWPKKKVKKKRTPKTAPAKTDQEAGSE
uniref:Uncharacterized protein n=1 Tax=Candidatus Kentrum sp. FM TaxID=2126340 RepID=A0A450WQX0_9GAMM|nr:MAG: hypothetical protein BECKFM1743A_GA0114220_106112 [Candidatus Kentron sp. FM]VFJ72411.1 MAG: hypothetical protein BECKFM1743C_GA0114222_106522 [Candidatus Kentron sp. FM]VFK19433.1 MAG: hypothetical protein BECKFM1743B_GA0114221_106193 [Candidatus Kentron sp. FM]